MIQIQQLFYPTPLNNDVVCYILTPAHMMLHKSQPISIHNFCASHFATSQST